MTTTSQNPMGRVPFEPVGGAHTPVGAGDGHPAALRWDALVRGLGQLLRERAMQASRVVVLVPYAQLMDTGRRAWARAHPDGFSPRFESSRNWATVLQPPAHAATDWSGDVARDSLVAASLLKQVLRGKPAPALEAVMVSRLLEAVRQLAPLAAAQPPAARQAWAARLGPSLALGPQALHWEALLASVALAWASTSAYATDVLWSPLAAPGEAADGLVLLQGFQQDPLGTALLAHWGERGHLLHMYEPPAVTARPGLHACSDAEDEAQRAAACVIEHANAGRVPVALVANDRLLTRRVSAMLHSAGLAVRDETGWKLSTTHVAARLMSLLRAAESDARSDEVLDFLKQAPGFPPEQVERLESRLRQAGVSHWRAAILHPQVQPHLPAGVVELLAGLQSPRPLGTWLNDLRVAAQRCAWWGDFNQDPAGQQLVQSLRLGEGAAHELDALAEDLADEPRDSAEPLRVPAGRLPAGRRPAGRMRLAVFTAWVRDVLEASSFTVGMEQAPEVVVLPMAQLLGRVFAATVAPACDERHLVASPEPVGQWTAAQRDSLGLPTRESAALAALQAWRAMLAQPPLDVLWRNQDNGEPVLPSPWVQSLAVAGPSEEGACDPRDGRALQPQPQHRPLPSAADLLPQALSASAYQDLRDCPYRFFALRQLRLQESDEIEAEPDKRDMGVWLHEVLRAFHEQRSTAEAAPSTPESDRARLDELATSVAKSMGLDTSQGQGRPGFFPFQAAWPALRDGYLDWLAGFEARTDRPGPRFSLGEQDMSVQVGPYRLVGKLDRVDLQDSPEGPIPFVIDYKTEPRKTTLERVKLPLEDTQIAFYAALQPDENVRAAYLSITESRDPKGADTPTRLVEQTQVLEARDRLLQGLVHDLDRVRAGHAMPALGEGRVCDYCAARGLCRKDFWSLA